MAVKVVSWILALVFLLSGGAKLAGLEFEIEAFTRWGYPVWFMYVVGVIEVAGAIGLLIPRLSALAGGLLAIFMLGAMGTHVLHAEWMMLVIASTIAGLSAWRGWVGRRDYCASKERPV